MKKIEIGCGRNKRTDGYECCDTRKIPGVDHVCKADDLPFPDNTVDEIYSRHLIEHLQLNEFLKTLSEWNRVLKVGGSVYIICPNVLWHMRQILDGEHTSMYENDSGKNDRYWGFGSVFGWQQDEYDFHKFGYYFELLQDILSESGFNSIENLTGTEASREQAEWHLEVRAKKVNEFQNYENHRLYNFFTVKH